MATRPNDRLPRQMGRATGNLRRWWQKQSACHQRSRRSSVCAGGPNGRHEVIEHGDPTAVGMWIQTRWVEQDPLAKPSGARPGDIDVEKVADVCGRVSLGIRLLERNRKEPRIG